jgi:hypothetical protein
LHFQIPLPYATVGAQPATAANNRLHP